MVLISLATAEASESVREGNPEEALREVVAIQNQGETWVEMGEELLNLDYFSTNIPPNGARIPPTTTWLKKTA